MKSTCVCFPRLSYGPNFDAVHLATVRTSAHHLAAGPSVMTDGVVKAWRARFSCCRHSSALYSRAFACFDTRPFEVRHESARPLCRRWRWPALCSISYSCCKFTALNRVRLPHGGRRAGEHGVASTGGVLLRVGWPIAAAAFAIGLVCCLRLPTDLTPAMAGIRAEGRALSVLEPSMRSCLAPPPADRTSRTTSAGAGQVFGRERQQIYLRRKGRSVGTRVGAVVFRRAFPVRAAQCTG